MLSANLRQAVTVWPLLSNMVFVPHTEAEYERAVALLEQLIDEVGEDQDHPLASLMETVGTLIEAYEREHFPEPIGSPIGALKLLMDEHGLEPSNLSELGDEPSAQQILAGKQKLTWPQIYALGVRFHVSPSVFVDDYQVNGATPL
ncbi:MAG: helix-turn-helix domain-containing protein [Ardenticatenaceae bacterium]